MTSAAIKLDQVTKTFDGRVMAVDAVTLDIAAGEFFSLLGPSGCGKTTSLRMIAGFEHPDSGRVHVGGKDITDLPVHRRDMGMVFQSYALFPHRTVAENVAFGLGTTSCTNDLRLHQARPGDQILRRPRRGRRWCHARHRGR